MGPNAYKPNPMHINKTNQLGSRQTTNKSKNDTNRDPTAYKLVKNNKKDTNRDPMHFNKSNPMHFNKPITFSADNKQSKKGYKSGPQMIKKHIL